MPPRDFLPPLECSLGATPRYAIRWGAEAKRLKSPISATIVVAVSRLTPRKAINPWTTGQNTDSDAALSICLSSASTRLLSALPAADFAKAVRAHWGIENGVHWMLDVNFREDAATVRKDHAAENLSRLKRIVLNLLKLETATTSFGKISLAKKRKLASWDDLYRMDILGVKQHDV